MNNRPDGRTYTQIRPLTLTRGYLPYPEGSCLVEMGVTRVLATATVENSVPHWLRGGGTGWITAEYGMLPRSTQIRNKRTPANGRAMEIQRLIGRALRAVSDLTLLGERSIIIDCDVINADGGTRVASIIGSAIALYDSGTWLIRNGITQKHIMKELVAAASVGVIGGIVLTDLNYEEDSTADVDMNVVMTESGNLVEVQGTAEGNPFGRALLDTMLDAAQSAIHEVIAHQKTVLGLP